jgi:hypothetical protein
MNSLFILKKRVIKDNKLMLCSLKYLDGKNLGLYGGNY